MARSIRRRARTPQTFLIAPAATLAVATALTVACGPRSPSAPHFVRPADLTAAERRFGLAPVRTSAVTYQPEVVLVDDGPDAIRSMSGNGMTWTIDAGASHAGELKPGSIMFATTRAVGRVLAVRPEGRNLAVTLGPVDITEVFREAHVDFDEPVDFGQAIAYEIPELPGMESAVTPLNAAVLPPSAGAVPVAVSYLAPFPTQPSIRNVAVTEPEIKVSPVAGPNGIGVRLSCDTKGVRLVGQTLLHLSSPRLRFVLDIERASVKTAVLELTGGAGLTMSFEAANVGRGNINWRREVTTDLGIPISGLPFGATVRQAFILKTGFTANGGLNATGDYTFKGGIQIGYKNGNFSVTPPTDFDKKESLLRSINGVSLGPSGLVLTHEMRLIVGVGAGVFTAGPYGGLVSTIGVSRGADSTWVQCRGATFNMSAIAGVGYSIPTSITKAINAILNVLNQPPIRGFGGVESKPMRFINYHGDNPDIKMCRTE